jgi:signal transduction histidine kinase
MNTRREPLLKRLPALFEIPALDPERARRRIEFMECNVMLPVKLFIAALIFYSFKYSPWIGSIASTPDVVVETVQAAFKFYLVASLGLAIPLLAVRRLPLAVLQWTTVTNSLVDGLFLAAMTLVTGGMDSILFWLFIGLIVRNAVSVPPGFSQIFLNFATSLCYALVAVLEFSVTNNLDETTQRAMDLNADGELGEPLLLRLTVLWLTTLSCSGLELLLERQRLATEEAVEFTARENQLRSAGRLAAEFAHQIKNPLTIINNAAYSLQRSVRQKKPVAPEQIEIIQEEVSRVDRVITQIMGYAQLSEGRVEKLDVARKIEKAIAQVFPAAVPSLIKVQCKITEPLPPLLMQRGHLTEIIVNLLQNAREALGEQGSVLVSAQCLRDHSVEISVADDGPGIPPERMEQIFEAYFTTKEKGTGLGLSIVRHNVELYGGTVRVDSALGQGAAFTVTFPAKSQNRLITS